MKRYDMVVPGNYFCDIIFTGLPTIPVLGTEIYSTSLAIVPGGVLNTVFALHRLGIKVGWLGTIGNDFFSQYVLQQVQSEGIDIGLIDQRAQALRQVTAALSYPQDRAFVSYVDEIPDPNLRLADELDNLECGHIHFAGLEVAPHMPDLLRRCRARGITVSMDCQCRPNTLAEPLVREVLQLVDVFMPNNSESLHLTGATDIHRAAEHLLAYVPYLVIKDGPQGAHSWQNGQYLHCPALPVTVVDTVGAGDVFNAGFLTAYQQGQDAATCLQWGNITGGLSIRGAGGAACAPRLADLLQFSTNG